VHRFLSPDFAWLPMLGAVCFLTLVNALTWWRCRSIFRWESGAVFLQLSTDVLGADGAALLRRRSTKSLRLALPAAAGDSPPRLCRAATLGAWRR